VVHQFDIQRKIGKKRLKPLKNEALERFLGSTFRENNGWYKNKLQIPKLWSPEALKEGPFGGFSSSKFGKYGRVMGGIGEIPEARSFEAPNRNI
jgi:hypothetical protein